MENKKLTTIVDKNTVSSWSHHSYSHEEKEAFCLFINFYLKDDADLKDLLPIDPTGENLFEAISSGILLCKMINKAQPGTILEKAINKKLPLNIY